MCIYINEIFFWVRTTIFEWRQHNMQKWQHHIIIIIITISNSSLIQKGNWKQFFFCYSNGNLLLPRASMCILHTFMKFDLFFISFSSGLHYIQIWIYIKAFLRCAYNLTLFFSRSMMKKKKIIYSTNAERYNEVHRREMREMKLTMVVVIAVVVAENNEIW